MIGAIEQAIVERIMGASTAGALGYPLATVASYGGELDDLAMAVRAFPAVWVAFAGERRAEVLGGGEFRHEGIFTLFIGTRSRRGDRAARHGVEGEPGSLQILEDVRAILLGDQLGLAIEPFAPVQVRSVSQTAQASIYACDLMTRWVSGSAAGFDDDAADFLRFHADYDIPPHGNVTAPLPAGEADAADDVYLHGDPD